MENNFLSIFGKKIMDYIYPQKEKKINIPLHILAKYYASSKLYRGAALSKNEYQSIKNYLKIKNENKNDISAVLYYLKNFGSFSKDEKKAMSIYKRCLREIKKSKSKPTV